MEFHPDKCQVLRITNKTTPIQVTYNIHNTPLTVVPHAKYLGVHIDSKLGWNVQCTALCNKANSTLAFLQRNLSSCPQDVKAKCFNTLVRPILEYGCSVWDPHQAGQIESIEKIHKRAARFVTSNYILTEGNTAKNMNTLSWHPLSERRARSKLTTLFKARAGTIEIPLDDLIPVGRVTRHSKNSLQIPQSSVDSHLHSFFPSTIRLWNNLPQHIKDCNTLESFRSKLETHTIRDAY